METLHIHVVPAQSPNIYYTDCGILLGWDRAYHSNLSSTTDQIVVKTTMNNRSPRRVRDVENMMSQLGTSRREHREKIEGVRESF